MQLFLNKKSTFVLCFIVNIAHFIDCSTPATGSDSIAVSPNEQQRIENVPITSITDQPAAATKSKEEHAKSLRNASFGGVKHNNYRSSYVEKRLNRRLSSISTKGVEDIPTTTEQIPFIKSKRTLADGFSDEVKYNVGPGVNIGVEKEKEIVSVYLDEDCLKDVFTGRGRKQDLITKILPLFILPFLIQSAVVPFLVSTLKLLLIKSIVVGKIAIFLLLLSAFRNHVKYGYDAGPAGFYPDVPNRRSEAHLTGYRVEGKPATWIN